MFSSAINRIFSFRKRPQDKRRIKGNTDNAASTSPATSLVNSNSFQVKDSPSRQINTTLYNELTNNMGCMEQMADETFHRQSSWNHKGFIPGNESSHFPNQLRQFSLKNYNMENSMANGHYSRRSEVLNGQENYINSIINVKPRRSRTLNYMDRRRNNFSSGLPTGHLEHSEFKQQNDYQRKLQDTYRDSTMNYQSSTPINNWPPKRTPSMDFGREELNFDTWYTRTQSIPSFPFYNISEDLLNRAEILKNNKFYGYELLEWISDSFSPANTYMANHFCNCMLVLDLIRQTGWDKSQVRTNTLPNIPINNLLKDPSPFCNKSMAFTSSSNRRNSFSQDDLYEWTHKIIGNSIDRRLEAFEKNFQNRMENKIQEYEMKIFKLKNDNVITTCDLQNQLEMLIKELEKYRILSNINDLNRFSWVSNQPPQPQTSTTTEEVDHNRNLISPPSKVNMDQRVFSTGEKVNKENVTREDKPETRKNSKLITLEDLKIFGLNDGVTETNFDEKFTTKSQVVSKEMEEIEEPSNLSKSVTKLKNSFEKDTAKVENEMKTDF